MSIDLLATKFCPGAAWSTRRIWLFKFSPALRLAAYRSSHWRNTPFEQRFPLPALAWARRNSISTENVAHVMAGTLQSYCVNHNTLLVSHHNLELLTAFIRPFFGVRNYESTYRVLTRCFDVMVFGANAFAVVHCK